MSSAHPADPDPAGFAAVVSRLRQAGCVFAEDEARLLIEAVAGADELAVLVGRRVGGEPLELVLGWAEFAGLRVAVAPGVFVPRRRTELLVRRVEQLLPRPAGGLLPDDGRATTSSPVPAPVVVDLCCGCGAVGAALAVWAGPLQVHACDVDPAAVACARGNLARSVGRAGGTAQVHLGDLYQALPTGLRGRVDVLVVNAPYVPTAEIALMPPEAREYEPRVALDGGADGLDVVRRVVAGAPQWLAAGGHLVLESGRRQAPLVLDLLTAAGLSGRVVGDDDLGGTAVVASRPGTR